MVNKKSEIEKIDRCISELVYEKIQLKKAYNYYHCIRDAEQFRHLEENYGLGTPTSVTFTPLIKKHIDVLVGEYLELDQDLQVTCKDNETISNIMRDKQLKIDEELYKYLKKYLQNAIVNILLNAEQPVNDPFVEKEMQQIKESVEQNFISEYEIAAQNILEYIKHSRDIDLKNKLRIMFTDLLVTGICYYRVKPSNDKDSMIFEVLDPLNTFIERNRNEFYLNRSRRAVIRKWMTREQIIEEYGDDLSDEAISQLDEESGRRSYDESAVFLHIERNLDTVDGQNSYAGMFRNDGILGGLEATPLFPWDHEGLFNYNNARVFPVYECQWMEWDKKKQKTILHEGVKIGNEIYIAKGECEYSIRSKTCPEKCTLNLNGMFFNDRNGQPFSLMLTTMDLQDKYDMLLFFRDNLIATSGTVGDWIDVASLPSFLGDEMTERLQKWKAYKKNSIALYDSNQEGGQLINTTFNGYDDTIKTDAIQAIQLAIDSIEQQASSITGVFAEKLGQIQERDAVSNVKVGIHQSTLLTKQYFFAMDQMYREVNYDLLNLAKFVYKHGMNGTIILGDRLVKTFTALPEHYTVTDYDIHIQDSSEVYKLKDNIQMLNTEFIKAQMVDPLMAVDILSAKNITALRKAIEKALKNQKAENDLQGQLKQQVEQLTEQNKQLQKQFNDSQNEVKRLQSQVDASTQAQIELDKKRVAIEEQEVRDKKDYNDKQIEVKKEQLLVEIQQMNDGNPYNDKVHDV